MALRPFNHFVQRELGKSPQILIHVALEWVLLIILFLDGFMAFIANEFAKFFDLPIPCILCTRIYHLIFHRNPGFYFNDSICESHKKDALFLSLCNAHKGLSDTKRMCENCILSEKKSDCDTYKSLVEDDGDNYLYPKPQVEVKNEGCSRCGKPLNTKSSYARIGYGSNGTICVHPQAPVSTPRTPFVPLKQDHNHTLEMSHVMYENDFGVPDDADGFNASITALDKKYAKATASEYEYPSEESMKTPRFMSDEACSRTPNFLKGSRFFGTPVTDSAKSSPRRTTRLQKKSSLKKSTLAASSNEVDRDSILQRLKMQVCLDRESLIALYMELDEERNAAAIAEKNAMAMITRLQAEKAAIQMEALQYRRMKEEEEEYDQEVLMGCRDLIFMRDEEMNDLQTEIANCSEEHGVDGMKQPVLSF